MRPLTRFLLVPVVSLCAALSGIVLTAPVAKADVSQPPWQDYVNGPSEPYTFQGPAAGDLYGNGTIDIVVAYPDGLVKMYDAHTGHTNWQYQTDGTISSTPTLADIYRNGQLETIVTTRGGSVYVFAPNGNIEPGWPQHTTNGTPTTSFQNAFFSSAAVGDLFNNGQLEITTTGWDHFLYVWYPNGQWVTGFPIDLSDTSWSTPTIVPDNTAANGNDVLVGADSSGQAYNEPYPAGGMWFRFPNSGCPAPDFNRINGNHSCNQVGNWPTHINQVAWSSAAYYNDGSPKVATGSGFYYGAPGAPGCLDGPCGKQLTVYNLTDGSIAFQNEVDGQIQGSPAIGNVGNGDSHDIVVSTNGGSLYGFNHTGGQIFHFGGGTYQWTNPVIAPYDQAGDRGVWAGNGAYLVALDTSGTQHASYAFGTGFVPGAPAIFNDGSGLMVAEVGATNGGSSWEINVQPLPGTLNANNALGAASWPRFHGDNRADGDAQASTPSSVPYNVTATAGNTVANVSWSQPTDVGSQVPIAYTIDTYTADAQGQQVLKQTFTSAPNGQVTGLTNGQAYYFRVSAQQGSGATSELSVPSFSVTPTPSTMPATAANNTVTAAVQYRLPNSDGASWQDLGSSLQTSLTAVAGTSYDISGNVDLWTSTPGFNQDIGICVRSSTGPCQSGDIVAWKESGGFAGTFSPNAAYVHVVDSSLAAGTTYDIRLVWKTNKAALYAQIWAGAGGPGNFSPTTLNVRAVRALGSPGVSTSQYTLSGSDGRTWQAVGNGSPVATAFSTTSEQFVVLTANADLWTNTAGYNQDIGIFLRGGAYNTSNPLGTLVAWKESGGFAGTFSPNAAFAETRVAVATATSYTATLVWKTNKPQAGTIYIGAGGPLFSPTTLYALGYDSGRTQFVSTGTPSSTQPTLGGSNGSTWSNLSTLTLTLSPPAPSCATVIGANADLWTNTNGINQDIGLTYNTSTTWWKESGGFAGTFSPNAAFVEHQLTTNANDTLTLQWKTNKPEGGATIYAGAGGAGNFSPTSLIVQYLC